MAVEMPARHQNQHEYYDNARLALANFMTQSAQRYSSLWALYEQLQPRYQLADFESRLSASLETDVNAINAHLAFLGGALAVHYTDRMDNEDMHGHFVSCLGYQGEGVWVMKFHNTTNYQDGAKVGIFADQIEGAILTA